MQSSRPELEEHPQSASSSGSRQPTPIEADADTLSRSAGTPKGYYNPTPSDAAPPVRVTLQEVHDEDGSRLETTLDYSGSRGATSISSVFTLCNSAVGAGVLSLPYAFQCAGKCSWCARKQPVPGKAALHCMSGAASPQVAHSKVFSVHPYPHHSTLLISLQVLWAASSCVSL
jgi:hypothetical protein